MPEPDPNAWPVLRWDSVGTVAALGARIREVATRARRFEAALEQASENEEVDLSTVEEQFDIWERSTEVVFVHTALGEGRPIAPGDVEGIAKELERAWEELREQRAAILERLGDAAVRVLAREPKVEIDDELLDVGEGVAEREDWDPEQSDAAFFEPEPGEEPYVPPEPEAGPPVGRRPAMLGDMMDGEPTESTVSQLTGEKRSTTMQSRTTSPMRAEEFRLRQAAEAKPCPKSPKLDALLEILPTDWLSEIQRTLGLSPDDEDMGAASRSEALRLQISAHLRSQEGLAAAFAALEEKARALLAEVLAKSSLRYSKLGSHWGLDEADGYYWGQRPPSGPLAQLRRSGLVCVCVRDGHRVVVAPTDLVEGLRSLLKPG